MAESVFVATLGAEPQVITLALDALLRRDPAISHVVVAHTLADRQPVRASFERLHEEFIVQRHYGDHLTYAPHLLAGLSGSLTDITTPAEIDDAFHSLYVLLRHHKHSDKRIHLCIAGGRKTMALFAMAAAQIVFEPGDRLWHVVSSPALIESKLLHAEHPDDVVLVPIPVASWGNMRTYDKDRARAFIETMLTPAEREVTQLLVREGLSNAALATRLYKSPKTIANQLSGVYVKLAAFYDLPEVPDRSQLLVLLGSYS